MQILTPENWTKVRSSYGNFRGKNEGTEGDGNPIGRPTVSTNLDSWELPETKPHIIEHSLASPSTPGIYVSEASVSGLNGRICV